VPVAALAQAMPALQQQGPHGVVPAPHGALVGPVHAAAAPDGRHMLHSPVVAPARATPSARRRDIGDARRRVNPSKSEALIAHSPSLNGPPQSYTRAETGVKVTPGDFD
jgi:hypothetical protein